MAGTYISDNEAISLQEFIEYNLVTSIKYDEEDTSLLYIYNILKVFERIGGFDQFADYEPDNK